MAKKTATKTAFPIPAMKKGETYIGAIVGAGGKGHHVILLPGDELKNWKDALAWAKKQGGDLPDRVEQALLFRDHKDQFKPSWYWSNTPYASDADSAWLQHFLNGFQTSGHESNVSRCRAVRRVAI